MGKAASRQMLYPHRHTSKIDYMDEKAAAPAVRGKILVTAACLFVSQGYAGISMREIANECGMSKAGLYYHFQDKEQLFLEILERNLEDLSSVISEASHQEGGGKVKIVYFVRAVFLDFSPSQSAIIRLANQEMAKLSPAAREKFNTRYLERFIFPLVSFFTEGIHSGEFREVNPQLAVWGLLGLMYPFLNPGHSWHPKGANGVIEFILSVFFDGISVRE